MSAVFAFRPAVRENVGLWINLIGGTGSGKTYTAMSLAKGIAGSKPFAVLDTENRRALHYADQFRFDHAEIRPPFRPSSYADAVVAADAAGYPVIVIDSGSHVWAGDGGVLDWQDEELEGLWERAKNNQNDRRTEWQVKEAGKMSAWIKPKMGHKQMVQKLLQVRAHIILCLRAEEKIEMVREKIDDKSDRTKTVIRPKMSLVGKDGWIPICDKNLPFEATCSFLLLASNPGIPHPIKLQEQHRALFPLDQPITEESGKRLAQWASGKPAESAGTPKPLNADRGTRDASRDGHRDSSASPADPTIDDKQLSTITDLLNAHGVKEADFLAFGDLAEAKDLPARLFTKACAWIKKQATT